MAKTSTSFKKGEGRKVGSENVLTKKGKELLYDVINGEIENVKSALDELRESSAKDYMTILVKLFEYIVPKKAEITLPPKIDIPMIEWTKTSKDDECQD